MRIVTWNIEWFTALFDADDLLLCDDGPSGRYGVTRGEQCDALAHVFRALDADLVMIIEAPDQGSRRSCTRALAGFAAFAGIRANVALMGFASESQQEIAVLHAPAALSMVHDPQGYPGPGHGGPRFDGSYSFTDPGSGRQEKVRWARPPLELLCQSAAGAVFRVIGVHTKSKAPSGARDADDMVRLGLENRRKQHGQCLWLRERIDALLEAGESLIVLGDFNDGPEEDAFEAQFPRSGVELVLGWDRSPELQLYDLNARKGLSKHLAAAPVSARFRQPDGQFISALLDYVMVSPDLRARDPQWCIWNPFDTPRCYGDPDLATALQLASDHFPVVLDIDL